MTRPEISPELTEKLEAALARFQGQTLTPALAYEMEAVMQPIIDAYIAAHFFDAPDAIQ